MSEPPTKSPSDAQKAFGDIAPALAHYTDDVLFGDVESRLQPAEQESRYHLLDQLHWGSRTEAFRKYPSMKTTQ